MLQSTFQAVRHGNREWHLGMKVRFNGWLRCEAARRDLFAAVDVIWILRGQNIQKCKQRAHTDMYTYTRVYTHTVMDVSDPMRIHGAVFHGTRL